MTREVVDVDGEKMARVTKNLTREEVVEQIRFCKNRLAKADAMYAEFEPKLADLRRILKLMPKPEPEPEPEPAEDS